MNDRKVIIEEQGLRDGIQNLDITLATSQKIELIKSLLDAGLQRIQIASFVHPRLVPQMADAEELLRQLDQRSGVLYSGLVLNVKGVERAIETNLQHISCSISASDTHSQKNTRMSLSEARTRFADMVALAKRNGLKVRGGIQCAFGCRYEGNIHQNHVLEMVDAHLAEGIDEIALADSTGMANPASMGSLMEQIVEKADGIPVVLHLHNTEGKGLANFYAALQAGVRIFDTAFGGLGGCPFIQGATGNIATEDTVHMLHQMGYETGIDLKRLVETAKKMEKILGQALPGKMYNLLDKDIQFI